jgi:hypothetical protein
MPSAVAFPSLFAVLAWYWWFGLLIWRVLQGSWRLIRRVPLFRSNASGVARP